MKRTFSRVTSVLIITAALAFTTPPASAYCGVCKALAPYPSRMGWGTIIMSWLSANAGIVISLM